MHILVLGRGSGLSDLARGLSVLSGIGILVRFGIVVVAVVIAVVVVIVIGNSLGLLLFGWFSRFPSNSLFEST